MVEQIILDLDNGNGQSAQARLDKLRGRDALYYYLYSEAVALQEDFARSDELGKKALDMPENREQWLLGAVYHRLAENARQQGTATMRRTHVNRNKIPGIRSVIIAISYSLRLEMPIILLLPIHFL